MHNQVVLCHMLYVFTLSMPFIVMSCSYTHTSPLPPSLYKQCVCVCVHVWKDEVETKEINTHVRHTPAHICRREHAHTDTHFGVISLPICVLG